MVVKKNDYHCIVSLEIPTKAHIFISLYIEWTAKPKNTRHESLWARPWLWVQLGLAGASTPQPADPMQPRRAMDVARHRIVHLLKTAFFFAHQFLLVFLRLMCGPRQLFFQCGPETPEGGQPWEGTPDWGGKELLSPRCDCTLHLGTKVFFKNTFPSAHSNM